MLLPLVVILDLECGNNNMYSSIILSNSLGIFLFQVFNILCFTCSVCNGLFLLLRFR